MEYEALHKLTVCIMPAAMRATHKYTQEEATHQLLPVAAYT